MTFLKRLAGMSRELKLFAISSLSLGMAFAMFDTIFNNFLNSRFTLSGFQRSFLEFPRELPGFLVIFISMLLWFLCSRRLGAVALALGAVGVLLVGFVSSTYAVLVVCLFIYSLGQHVFLPLAATIGMELASDGKTGQRLGQLNAVRNLATIIGSFVVYLGFKFLGFTFRGKKLRWSERAYQDFRHRLRKLTGRSWGVSMDYRLQKLAEYVRGWMGYFGISDYYRPIPELDHWLRRRVRMCYWKQWRGVRNRIRHLLALGTPKRSAIWTGMSSKSYWHLSRSLGTQTGMTNDWLKGQGLISIRDQWMSAHGYA